MKELIEALLGRRVVALDTRPLAYRTSFALDDVRVELEDGERLRLVLKHLDRSSLSPEAAGAKPKFLLDPQRELEAYRVAVTPGWPRSATVHGSLADPERNRFLLLLEHVRGVELFQVGELSAWCEAARRLAAFHRRSRRVRSRHLVRYDERYYRTWADRARELADGDDFRRILRSYERTIPRLLSLPPTVVHGDFYASNVLVDAATSGFRVCPVDWELAGRGPALVDLAALTAGSWGRSERGELVLAYYLSGEGRRPDFGRFLESLECCRLHLSVRSLAWAPGWTPPPEHRHDWLEEGLRASARLARGVGTG